MAGRRLQQTSRWRDAARWAACTAPAAAPQQCAGVLARRRDATQIYYRIGSERAASLCRAVCTQIAVEIDGGDSIPPAERLAPLATLKA